MARFLRDEQFSNVTLTEERLTQLHDVFDARRHTMPEELLPAQNNQIKVFFSYIIRFDNKGYRVFSIGDLLAHFRQADYIERVIFTIESKESMRSARAVGSFMELRFDEKEPTNCFLQVSSDDGDWVDASLSAVKERTNRFKNRNGWAKSAWSELAIQIGGVFTGFLLSLWAAVRMSPLIAIENSFFITFLFALLMFSNLWAYLNRVVLNFVRAVFPSIKFYRPDRDRWHWLLQSVVGGIVVAIVLLLLAYLLSYVGRTLGELFMENG